LIIVSVFRNFEICISVPRFSSSNDTVFEGVIQGSICALKHGSISA
jgi:hypothetical protein